MEEKKINENKVSTATTRFIYNIRTLVTQRGKGKTAYFRSRRTSIIKKECPFISLLREYIVRNLDYESLYSFFRTDPLIRSKQNIKAIGDFLAMGKNEVFNDLKERNSRLLYTVINCLLLEHYNKGEIIFFENCDIEKYYIVLNGKVSLYKRKMKKKEMTISNFMNYLSDIYNLKYDIEKNVYRKIQRKNYSLYHDLNWILTDTFEIPNIVNENEKRFFLIDENVKYYDVSNGESINEISILTNFKETFSAYATEDSYILYLKKHTFYSILLKDLQKELDYYIKELRTSYILFKNWTSNAIEKILRISIPEKPFFNDIILEQKGYSDYVYFVGSGTFKIYVDISIESSKRFKQYILNEKTNLLNWLKSLKLKTNDFSQNEVDEFIHAQRKKIQKYPINYLFRTNYDKYIKSKVGIKDNVLDIKLKEEKIASEKYIQRVFIGNLNEGEFFGLEDSIELKQRYYSVKCCSENGLLRKIHINDLVYIIANTKTINIDFIYDIIKEKKLLLIEKINRGVSIISRRNKRDMYIAYSKALSLEKKEPKIFKRTKNLENSKFSLTKNINESIIDSYEKNEEFIKKHEKINLKKNYFYNSINVSKDKSPYSNLSLSKEKCSNGIKRKQFISLLNNPKSYQSSFSDSEPFNSIQIKNTTHSLINKDSSNSISFNIPFKNSSLNTNKYKIYNHIHSKKRYCINFKQAEKNLLKMTGIFKTDRRKKREFNYNLNLNLISSARNNYLSNQIISEGKNIKDKIKKPKITKKIHQRVYSASLSQRAKAIFKIKINSPKKN